MMVIFQKMRIFQLFIVYFFLKIVHSLFIFCEKKIRKCAFSFYFLCIFLLKIVYSRFISCEKKIKNSVFSFYLLCIFLIFSSTYLHQTFTECMSNQYTHFDISTCQVVRLINPFILICLYARCNYKLRNVPWFNWVLWKF